MERSLSSTALSEASTQDNDEELNLDDTQQDVDSDAELSVAKPLNKEDARKTDTDIVRKHTRSTPRTRRGKPGASSAMASPFALPPPLMECNLPPYVASQTPMRHNMSSGPSDTPRGRLSRHVTPRSGLSQFSSRRRPHNTISDKSSPESQAGSSVFSSGGQFDSPPASDGNARMRPLSRPSPFGGFPGPRSSQPNAKGEVTYPLVFIAPGGFISILLRQNLVVEMSVDRCLRVIKFGYFAAFVDHHGTASSVVHPHARILHQGDSVCGKFTSMNDKMVIFGKPGVLFSMDHLREAYLISATNKNPSPVAVERLEFPKMNEDSTMMQFYRESQLGTQFLSLCKEMIDEASYDRRGDGTLVLNINGITIRYSRNGDLHVDARPRHIKCTADGSVHVRTGFIDTNIQTPDMAFIKYGPKRVHISRSGMVASDGSACTSMDNFGRIIAST